MSSDYRVNKATGQVVKDDGTGWKPVASVRNKTTGEILIDEGNGWQPMPGSQRNIQADPAMTMASQRANTAMASGQKIAQDDLTQLGRPDFSTAAMARLPAPTKSVADLDAFDAQRAAEKEALRVPDSNFKERSILALNTPTFGSGPRFAAGMQTLGALAATPFVEGDIIDQKGISGATSQFLDEARIHQRRGRDERQLESLGIELIPGLLQGKTIIDTLGKKVLPATNTVSNVGRVAGVGGLYGAIYAGSQNESGTAEGVAQDAAFGGALGVGGGLVLKAAQPGATAGLRTAKTAGASLYDALAATLGKAGGARDRVAQDVAIAAVRRSMERSGMTLDQIMEQVQRYEGKPAVLAEVIGQDAVNALTALTRRPGSTPQKAQDIIEERFYGRPDRLKGDVEDATGISIGQLDETLDTQLAERQEAAKPIYDALYKRFNKIESFRQPGQTGQVMKRLNRLGRTPLAQRHLQTAKDAVATSAGRRGIAISKMSTMEYWDLVKRSLDNAIDSAQKKGEGSTRVGEDLRDLVGLKDDLVSELDRLTDGAYAAAREAGGEAPRLKAAATAGQKALQARNPRDVARTVAATLAQDLPALRAGMVDDLGTRIDKGMTPGRVRVPDVAGKLREGLGEEAANKLINRFDAEAALSETGARWAPRMNSVTGTVMESGATAMGDDLINAGMNLASGNKLGLLRQAINFMRQRGFSQRQIDAIGDLLLSSPEEGLRRLRVMAPDGVPSSAAAPIAGAGGPDGLPPGGGGGITPQAAQAASAPAGPIRAGGFAGFGGKKPPVERTIDEVSRDIKDIERQLKKKGFTLNQAETLAENGTLPAELRGLMIQHGDLVRESGRLQDAGARAGGSLLRNPQYQRLESEMNKASDDISNAEAEIAAELRKQGLNWDGEDGDFMNVIDKLKREGRLSNYLTSRVADLRAAANRYFDAEEKMLAMARAPSANGLSGLRTDAGPGAVGGFIGFNQDGEPISADNIGTKLRNAGIGAGIGVAANRIPVKSGQAAKLPPPASRKPLPPPPPKRRDIGTKAADATAIAALTIAPPAEGQTQDGSAELQAANERVRVASETVANTRGNITKLQSQLEMLQDPNGDISAKQEILKLRGRPLGKTGPKGDGVDGVDGPATTAAITDEAAKIEAAIAREQGSLKTAQKEEAAARKDLTQAEMLKIQEDAKPGKGTELAREFGPYSAIAAAIAGAYLLRRGAGGKAKIAAQAAAQRANDLLTSAPINRRAGVNHPNGINVRATNLNDFWRQGGAGEATPFEELQKGSWKPRAKGKVANPSTLYPEPGFFSSRLRTADYGWAATGVAEAKTAEGFRKGEEQKIAKYEAEVEKFAAAGDKAGLQRATQNLEQAKNMYSLYLAFERAGWTFAGTRLVAGMKDPYAFVRPNIRAAEEEASSLRTAINKK